MAKDKEKLNELSEEDVGKISGGYYFNASHGCGHDKPCYEVIGSKGEILESFGTKEEAMNYARENNIADYELSWNQLAQLRNGEKPKLDPVKKDKFLPALPIDVLPHPVMPLPHRDPFREMVLNKKNKGED